jgi:membrane associated rhomboid family serine protease
MGSVSDGGVFDVRFYLNKRDWPSNPYGFTGSGQVAMEGEFMVLRGHSHRAFRFPKRQEQWVRIGDIINVRVEAEDVIFNVMHMPGEPEVGFSVADRDTARRIAALLPTRRTEEFAVSHAEREVFHDRIDYWSPSTPVLTFLLVSNIVIYLLMWVERQTPGLSPFMHFLGWRSPGEVGAHLQVLAMRALSLGFQLADPGTWGRILASLFGFGPGSAPGTLQAQAFAWGANEARLTIGVGQWWRLVSSMFLHGSLLHLFFNMFALWQVGQLTERIFGSARFAVLYLLAGISGSVASVYWGLWKYVHYGTHLQYSVGASGAIFGIIGGLLAFIGRPDSGVPPTVVRDLRGSIFPFLLFNIAAGVLYPHTDNAAHLGGLAGGWLAGLLLARSLHVPGRDAR